MAHGNGPRTNRIRFVWMWASVPNAAGGEPDCREDRCANAAAARYYSLTVLFGLSVNG